MTYVTSFETKNIWGRLTLQINTKPGVVTQNFSNKTLSLNVQQVIYDSVHPFLKTHLNSPPSPSFPLHWLLANTMNSAWEKDKQCFALASAHSVTTLYRLPKEGPSLGDSQVDLDKDSTCGV